MPEDLVQGLEMTLTNTKPEFPFYVEKKLDKVLKTLIDRLDKRDVWILISGREGDGKTNMLAYILYYFSYHTKRKLDINNLYFDADSLRKYTQSHSNQLVGWDEAAIGGLSAQWLNKSQVYMMQLAMTGRIKHHVVVMCIPQFEKLKDYFVQRANMMIRVYTKGNTYGRYMVFSRKSLSALYTEWRRTKRLKLKKYKKFNGYCPEVFSKIFTEEEQKQYEKNKLDMIASIGNIKESKEKLKYDDEVKRIKYRVSTLKFPIRTQTDFVKQFGISAKTLLTWRKDYKKFGNFDINE